MTTADSDLVTVTMVFSKDPTHGWMVSNSLPNGEIGNVPLHTLPIDSLCAISSMLKKNINEVEDGLKQDLARTLNELKTARANADLSGITPLGEGEFLIDGVVNRFYPTVVVSPKDLQADGQDSKKTLSYEEATKHVASLLQDAVDGKIKVSLKDPAKKFDYMKEGIAIMFGVDQIEFFIEGFGGQPDPEDIMDGNLRYVSSVTLADGQIYHYGRDMDDALGEYENVRENNSDYKFTKLRQLLDLLEAAV